MAKKKQENWRNRIIAASEKAASEFNYHPDNFRLHNDPQRGAINAVLSEVGWVASVIENRRTGNLIDGHLRVEEALRKGANTSVPYTLVDLTEEEEKKILMVLDQIGSLATIDSETFAGIAESVGFDSPDLSALVSQMSGNRLDDIAEPNLNDPNFDYKNQFGVIVECTGEAHQKRVFDELQNLGHKVKVVVV